MSEQSAHEALAQFLTVATPRLPDLAFVWHTANESSGGAKSSRGIPLDVLKEARMGAVAGVWDWLYIGANVHRIGDIPSYVYIGLAIELKSTKAFRTANQGLSNAQIAWRRHYIKHGWYTVVYPEQDWHEAARLLVQWTGGKLEDFDFS